MEFEEWAVEDSDTGEDSDIIDVTSIHFLCVRLQVKKVFQFHVITYQTEIIVFIFLILCHFNIGRNSRI